MHRALLLSSTLAAALGFVACTGDAPAAPPADPSSLMEADRAFAADVASGGSRAWASWMADDGAQIVPGAGEVRGHEAILELMAGLDDPTSTLTWEPVRADVAASGDLGWTTGTYVSEGTGPDGARRHAEGRYVTIWRRQPDGAWKVVMDLGNPTTPPAAEGGEEG